MKACTKCGSFSTPAQLEIDRLKDLLSLATEALEFLVNAADDWCDDTKEDDHMPGWFTCRQGIEQARGALEKIKKC